MFNLDQAITEWRRQMAAGGIISAEVLDELESHLRDDIEQQVNSGMTVQAAFDAAARRIGQSAILSVEFSRANPPKLTPKWKLAYACCLGAAAIIMLSLFFMAEMVSPVISILTVLVCAGTSAMLILSYVIEQDAEKGLIYVPSLSDFTTTAQHSLASAREEAARFAHDFIGTEHVLLGLAGTENGKVSAILRRLGVTSEAVRREVESVVGLGSFPHSVDSIPYTPRAAKALQLAISEAKALNQSRVNAEHILMGLLLEGSGVASVVLKKLGISNKKLRAEILKG